MSRVFFHGFERTVEVFGSERAYASNCIENLFLAMLNLPVFSGEFDNFVEILPDGYIKNAILREEHQYNFSRFSIDFRRWVAHNSEAKLCFGKHAVELWSIALNTAFRVGNDPMKFFARLHGQCEIHCYIKPKNFQWLADIIQEGLDSGLYRLKMGWEGVIELLKEKSQYPIVLSYSVCHSFPNMHLAWNGKMVESFKKYEERWDKLPRRNQWLAGLRAIGRMNGLELKPERWTNFYFNSGLDAFKLNEILYLPHEQRVRIIDQYLTCRGISTQDAWTVSFRQEERRVCHQ